MLKARKENENLSLDTDAVKPFVPLIIPSIPKHSERQKRDSGYGTDYSPASIATGSRHFTFDSDVDEADLNFSYEFQNMDISNEVFTDDDKDHSDDNDESDEADKEVEDLFSGSGDLGQYYAISEPLEINALRPAAPLPTPLKDLDECVKEKDDTSMNDFQYSLESHVCHSTSWSGQRHCKRYHFRPISCSVGTQTQDSHKTAIDDDRDIARPRFQPYDCGRGSAARRLKDKAEYKQHTIRGGPLPDIVPAPRDRSVSLPDMPGSRQPYEREIGRELRRISDEFVSDSHKDRLRQIPFHRTSSLSFNILGYWGNIRQYLSPPPPPKD